MARYTGPRVRISRRIGFNVFDVADQFNILRSPQKVREPWGQPEKNALAPVPR